MVIQKYMRQLMNFLRLLVPASAFQRPAAAAQRLPLIGNACHSLTIQVFILWWLCDQIIMNKMSWLFDWLLDWLFVWFFDWLFEDQTIDGAINMEETNWCHWFFFTNTIITVSFFFQFFGQVSLEPREATNQLISVLLHGSCWFSCDVEEQEQTKRFKAWFLKGKSRTEQDNLGATDFGDPQ
jgi:hypothetical protein